MTGIFVSAKKYKLVKVESSGDGEVHYKTDRGEFDPFVTFCGDVDTGFIYEETSKKVTCSVCNHTAKVFKNGVIA